MPARDLVGWTGVCRGVFVCDGFPAGRLIAGVAFYHKALTNLPQSKGTAGFSALHMTSLNFTFARCAHWPSAGGSAGSTSTRVIAPILKSELASAGLCREMARM